MSRRTTSRNLALVRPVAARPTERTASTLSSCRHSRKTACPTMPVAPKRITFIVVPEFSQIFLTGYHENREVAGEHDCGVGSLLYSDSAEPGRATIQRTRIGHRSGNLPGWPMVGLRVRSWRLAV